MGSILFLGLMMGMLYAIMIRPQQKRMKEHQALLRDLGEGDLGELPPPWDVFRVEARGRRSDFEGLVLAEVGVYDDVDAERPRFVLRQLLPARGADLDALDAAFEDRFDDALGEPFEIEAESDLFGGAAP